MPATRSRSRSTASSRVFGWSGGKALVESSYADAKVKGRELKAKRKKG